MATPLINNDFLSSPIHPGIISDKTASLIASEGERLGQQIELRSTTAEAQFKAPQITELYSSAYQKIVAGDMTGFADMQKARSLAIGNPILMSTLNQADSIAGHLANQYLVTSKSASSSADILDRQATIADINAANTEYHQATYAYEREKAAITKNDAAALKAWEIKDRADRELIAAGDTTVQLTPRPEPTQLPPPPTKRAPTRYKGGAPAGPITPYSNPSLPEGGTGDASAPLFRMDDNPLADPAARVGPPLPANFNSTTAPAASQPKVANRVARAEPVDPLLGVPKISDYKAPPDTNPGVQSAIATVAPSSSALPAAPTSMASAVPAQMQKGEPLVNQIPFGDAVISYKKPAPDLTKKTVSEKSGVTGTIEYPKEDQLFVGAVNIIQSKAPEFAQFVADAGREKQQVKFEDTNQKTASGQEIYKAVRTDGTVLSKPKMDPLGQRAVLDKGNNIQRVPMEFTKSKDSKQVKDPADLKDVDVVDAWNLATGLMHKVGFKMDFPEKKGPKLSEDQLKRMDEQSIAAIDKNPNLATEINKDRKLVGLPVYDPATKVEAIKSKQEQDRIDSELAKRGIVAEVKDTRTPIAEVEKELSEATTRIKQLEEQLDSMKGTKDITAARSVQRKLLELKDRAGILRTEVARRNPVVVMPEML